MKIKLDRIQSLNSEFNPVISLTTGSAGRMRVRGQVPGVTCLHRNPGLGPASGRQTGNLKWVLLAGPCARDSKRTGSCLGQRGYGKSPHRGRGKVPAVQGECPRPGLTRKSRLDLEPRKLPECPGTPLHLSPPSEKECHVASAVPVWPAAWGPPHLGLTQNPNSDLSPGGQGQPLGQSPAQVPSTFLRAGHVQATNPQEATGSDRAGLPMMILPRQNSQTWNLPIKGPSHRLLSPSSSSVLLKWSSTLCSPCPPSPILSPPFVCGKVLV